MMVISVVVGVSAAIAVIGYFGGMVLKVLSRF
jgi:ABC-type microcin C transport system permease subunit YejE